MTTPVPIDADSTRSLLALLVRTRQDEIDRIVQEALAAFSRDVADGKVQLAPSAKDGSIEKIRAQWLPSASGWFRAKDRVLKALAKASGMITSWNGCHQCPIWFAPPAKPKDKTPPAGENVILALQTLGALFRGEEGTAGGQAALTAMLGRGAVEPHPYCRAERTECMEPCEHQRAAYTREFPECSMMRQWA